MDIGATEIFVAVPADRAAENVRSFPTFTQDLYALADWWRQCGIHTVAMESTGVYWIPLFQILEERGFEVCLVNARHVKNVPGHRTDVSDCQWLQFLHSVGLLKASSYRPEQEVCAVRSLLRDADERYQRMVADAESVCSFQAPLGWAEAKLTAIEGMKQSAEPKVVREHCDEVRTMFVRVAPKFRTAERIKAANDRFKVVCRGGRDY